MLAPLLFSMLFNAVLRMMVERFGANADIVKDMVCTKVKDERRGGGSERGRRKGEINPS